MYYLNETSLIVDGAISSGGTITSLILAYYLNKKFIYAGGTYKHIAIQLGYDTMHGGLMEFEKKYGEQWDNLWEKYITWKIDKTKNLVINSKLAGFLADPEPWLFRVFLTARPEVRMHRAGTDKRTEQIIERDKELTQRWKKLFDIDISNIDEIQLSHDLMLDNSDMSISETVLTIFNAMKRAFGFEQIITLSDLEKVEKVAHAKGKNFFQDKLKSKGLLIDHSEIFDDWIKYFDNDLSKMPEDWQKVVYS